MNYGEYIWQSPHWPDWQYDLAALADSLAAVSHAQGLLLGRLKKGVGLHFLTAENAVRHLNRICS